MSQPPANATVNHEELWNIYRLGAAGLDVLAMIVNESDEVMAESIAGTDLPKSNSNLGAMIQNVIVNSTSSTSKQQAEVSCQPSALLDVSDEGSLKKTSTSISVKEIYMICPLLAALSNRISDYFQSNPIPLDPSVLLPEVAALSLKDFQKQCLEFQQNCTIEPSNYPPEQARMLTRIFTTLQQIIDFPKTTQPSMPKLESLEILLTATERILEKLPRYENQTGIMSAKNREKLSKTQVLVFVERLMRDPLAEDVVETKSSDSAEETLEKLWKLSKRLESQTYNWTRENEVHLQTSGLQQVIEMGERRRIEGQDWINPAMQRNSYMESLGIQITQLPKAIESQIYYPTEVKQKQMYLSKIEGHLEKLGRPMMADQRALSKNDVKNLKFSEVDQILENVPSRFNSQCANALARPFVERNNSELSLVNPESPPEARTLDKNMKEKRKSIQSSLGNVIAKLSGSKIVTSDGDFGNKSPPLAKKSDLKGKEGQGLGQNTNSKSSNAVNSGTSAEDMVEKSNLRLNSQAADGLNISNNKHRDVINIVKASAPVMSNQRAEMRKSHISGITHSEF